MPVTSVDTDAESLTMTIRAEFPVAVHRLWDAYADPRQLERFWGPEGYPATFTRHDVAVGGRSTYYMTGPDGERYHSYWEFVAIDPGRSFEVLDGFLHPDGQPNPDLPVTRTVFTFSPNGSGSRLVATSHFPSPEALERLLAMGVEEGTRSAMSQIDDVVADLASFAADRAAEAQVLSDTQVRVARVIRGTRQQVWEAHHDAELLRRWQLGPDGWTMPVCEPAAAAGDAYRFEWEREGGGERFGFTGEVLESAAPVREVATERMIGMDTPDVVNELTLTEVEGGTLLSLVITYPSAEVRDTVLSTGMTEGMEASYARLESLL